MHKDNSFFDLDNEIKEIESFNPTTNQIEALNKLSFAECTKVDPDISFNVYLAWNSFRYLQALRYLRAGKSFTYRFI